MPRHNYIPLTPRRRDGGSGGGSSDDDGAASSSLQLDETDDGFTPKQPSCAPRGIHARNKRHLVYAVALVAALTLVFAFSAPHTLSFPAWRAGSNSTSAPPLRGCGRSADAAAKAGCTFDVMALAWVDPACYDEALTEEFLAVQAWKWWADKKGAEEVLREELPLPGKKSVWVTWEYQRQQCVFLWKKLQRAVVDKASVDSFTLDPDHTAECADMLVSKERPAEGTKTEIKTRYTTCGLEA